MLHLEIFLLDFKSAKDYYPLQFPLLQLLARIERMERRLQLTRKDPPRDKRLFQPLESWTPDKDDMWDLDIEENPQSNPGAQLPFNRDGKGQKR